MGTAEFAAKAWWAALTSLGVCVAVFIIILFAALIYAVVLEIFKSTK